MGILHVLSEIIVIWVEAGIMWMVLEWLNGWPKIIGDRKYIDKHMALLEKSYPESNPRMLIARGVLFAYIIAGPFGWIVGESPP